MSHDGLPARAADGAREARADRRASASGRLSLLRHALPAAAVTGVVTHRLDRQQRRGGRGHQLDRNDDLQ